MSLTATELRSNLYRVLDAVLESGEPVEILRHGRVLRIVPDDPPCRLDRLVERLDVVRGDPDDLARVDWSDAWQP